MIEKTSVTMSHHCLPVVVSCLRDDESALPSSSVSSSSSRTWADELDCDEVWEEDEEVEEEEEETEDRREAGKKVAAALARSSESSC